MNTELRRARTQDQKYFRRKEILEAAERLLDEVGYEAFSMANLAKLAGVVKGTLYLYFKTREEVLLTLYNQSLERWSHVFLDRLNDAMRDRDYVLALYQTAVADRSFIPLLTRLEHVIEHNVSIDSLIESKRHFIDRVDCIAKASAPVLSLNDPKASEVVNVMGVLLIGATRADQGPSLEGEDIPRDVQSLLKSFSSEAIFIKNACRIIAGIRADIG